jgi:hypothetical protein
MSTIAHIHLIPFLIVFSGAQGVPIFIKFDVTLVTKSIEAPSKEPAR